MDFDIPEESHSKAPVSDNDRWLENRWYSLEQALKTRNLTDAVIEVIDADLPSELPVSAKDSWAILRPRLFDISTPETRQLSARPNKSRFIYTGLALTVFLIVGLLIQIPGVNDSMVNTAAIYSTPAGSRATVELSDGTSIMLNVASRLEVPENFGKSVRTVKLEGEASFNVVHSSGIPFSVNAANTQTTVLGTEFGIRAYPKNPFQVVVRSGKVSVDTSVLSANDMLRIVNGNPEIIRDRGIDKALAFAEGKLVIDNRPLADAIDDLNRWYNADIHLSHDSLGSMMMDAVLMEGSIGDLMEVLQAIFGVNIVRDGRRITLSPR